MSKIDVGLLAGMILIAPHVGESAACVLAAGLFVCGAIFTLFDLDKP